MEAIIEVDGLRKSYGNHTAVDGVSLAVSRGEIFGLLGRNGAGKTTLVEILQGLRRRDAGTVSVLGHDPGRNWHAVHRRVGSQLQEAALPARLRVAEAIDLFGSLADEPVPTSALLADWDLTHLARRPFAGLSGGEQQRLFLALALVNDPELVFLDELTTGLDPAARRDTWALIDRIRDRGVTVVLVTHSMEEAARLCDRVAVLRAGRIVAVDTPDRLTTATGQPTAVSFQAAGHTVSFLSRLGSVTSLTRSGERVVVTGDRYLPVDVAAALAGRGIRPPDYRVHQPDLEQAFLALTKE